MYLIVTFYLLDRIIKLDWVLKSKWRCVKCRGERTSSSCVYSECYKYLNCWVNRSMLCTMRWTVADDASCRRIIAGSIVNYHLWYVEVWSELSPIAWTFTTTIVTKMYSKIINNYVIMHILFLFYCILRLKFLLCKK